MTSAHIMDSRHAFGTSQRIFLNLDLGCASACSYCYLPQQGLEIGRRMQAAQRINAATLIAALLNNVHYVPGRHGTVLSIGCFSETWDPLNRTATIELIGRLIEFGNPIQVATKRRLTLEHLHTVTVGIQWEKQLTFYISTATTSRWREYEAKTEDPKRRFKSLELHNSLGIGVILYIKPVLPGVTIFDVHDYSRLVERHNVPVVVGDRFDEEKAGPLSVISNSLYVIENSETSIIRNILSSSTNVYANSLEIVELYRRKS